jgi:putative nucleotidyltransferase with HDIG domain
MMELFERIVAFVEARRIKAYVVGGSVRDQALGRRETRDIDLAIEGNASGLARAFADAEGGAFYLMDAEHNVARVIFDQDYVDWAELRGNLETDLASRDFCINAMALPVSRELLLDSHRSSFVVGDIVDPFHGLRDIERRQIRTVSDHVFRDDPVRLLRAVRLAGELGFSFEKQTEQLIRADAHLLASASAERARDEFFKTLALTNANESLRYLDELGLLGALIPEVVALKGIAQSAPHDYDAFEHTLHVFKELVAIQKRSYAGIAGGDFSTELEEHFGKTMSAERTRGTLLRLCAILHDIGKPLTQSIDDHGRIHFYEHEERGAKLAEAISRHLRLSNTEFAIVTTVIRNHLRPAQLARALPFSNRAVYRFFRDAGESGLDVGVLALADLYGKAPDKTDAEDESRLRATLARLFESYYRSPEKVVTLPKLVDGSMLMRELELAPGPRVGELLEAIQEAQADGQVTTRAEALALANKMLEEGKGKNG